MSKVSKLDKIQAKDENNKDKTETKKLAWDTNDINGVD